MFILQSICRGFFKVAAVAAILGHIGTVITTLLSDAALSRRASQLNMERYRSGHNGTDSKSCDISQIPSNNSIWTGIEGVVTSRTRNAVVRKGTWVRIPPCPPKGGPESVCFQGFCIFPDFQ